MNRPLLSSLLLATLFLALSSPLGAGEYRETEEFADVVRRVEQYADRFGADEVLLVIDIDNTLLAMKEEIGSDQWFEWQNHLLENEPDSPDLVADSFPGLLSVQGLLFALGEMRPPQEDQPEMIKKVQAMGVKTLVLTSRGDEFRVPTERELESAGYDFATSALEVSDPREGTYAPYDLEDPQQVGISPHEARLYGLAEDPRPVSYENGVFMTSGQHKGVMLLTLLHRSPFKPRAVVFVDDHGRHVARVFSALSRRWIEVSTFHYQREDTNVKNFRYSDKEDVRARWREIEAGLEQQAEPAAAE